MGFRKTEYTAGCKLLNGSLIQPEIRVDITTGTDITRLFRKKDLLGG
jgi:hypothetical protein